MDHPGAGDADGPEHQEIDHRRIAHHADAVDHADHRIEHREHPLAQQHDGNIPVRIHQHRFIPGKDPHQRGPEHQEEQPARKRDRPRGERDPPASPAQPVISSRAVVLAGEGGGRRGQARNGDIGNPGDPPGDRLPRHEEGALGVGQRLQRHMPEGIQGMIEADGQPDPQDRPELLPGRLQGEHRIIQLRIMLPDIDDADDPADIDGGAGGQGRAGDIHAQSRDQRQVQHHVHGAGDQEKKQGGGAVSHAPQDPRVHIIADVPEGAGQDDAHIGHGQIHRVLRDLHEAQDQRGDEDPQQAHSRAADPHEGTGRPAQGHGALPVARADGLGNQDRHARSDSQKNTQDDLHRLGAGSHGRQGNGSAVRPDHQGVHSGIQLLKHIAEHEGKREEQDIAQDGPFGHIDRSAPDCHAAPPPGLTGRTDGL